MRKAAGRPVWLVLGIGFAVVIAAATAIAITLAGTRSAGSPGSTGSTATPTTGLPEHQAATSAAAAVAGAAAAAEAAVRAPAADPAATSTSPPLLPDHSGPVNQPPQGTSASAPPTILSGDEGQPGAFAPGSPNPCFVAGKSCK